MSDDDAAPKASRRRDGTFNKKHTGNSKGAPRGSRRSRLGSVFDILDDERFEPVATGLPPDLNPAYESAHLTYVAAIAGKKRSIRIILEHILRREDERVRQSALEQPPPLRIMEPHDPDNANSALLLLQIAVPVENLDPRGERPWLKLAPWAVQAAIGRRHGQRLSDDDVKAIEFATDNPEMLRWPRGYKSGSSRA